MKVIHLLSTGGIGGIESLCVEIERHSSIENHFYFVFGGGERADELINLGAHVVVRNFKYKNIVNEYKNLKIYCQKNEITIILIHGTPVLWLYGIFLTKEETFKVYLYAHANAAGFLEVGGKANRVMRKFLFRKIAYKCNGIFAISHSVEKSIQRYVSKTSTIYVVYNGVDLKRFSSQEKAKDTNMLIYVGRLSLGKGVENLLYALSNVKLDWQLMIVGNGTEMVRLKKLAESLKLESKVIFAGEQNNVYDWYQKATIFVHPAVLEEGFGIAIIEAMAMGLPCIAFKRGAIPEIIQNNVSGFLIDETDDDILALSQKIDQVLAIINTDSKAWADYRTNARLQAQKFSIDKMVKELEAILTS